MQQQSLEKVCILHPIDTVWRDCLFLFCLQLARRGEELIEQGWNSLEFKNLLTGDLKQIGASAGLALLINLIIEVIYLFCFETTDDQNLRRVKVKKILSMSDVMASSSNILFVALTKNMAKLNYRRICSYDDNTLAFP